MTNENKKIRIAFVKFGGLCAGGTEKALQTIAANLPKDEFEVDYFYCGAAPYIGSSFKHPDTDLNRKQYMIDKGVNLIKFNVGFKNVTIPTHDWVDTNFWELFDESKYDIIQTARAGHSEYPFIHINKTPIIDLITLPGMAEVKSNVYKTVHISKFQADTWIKAGGLPGSIEIIPLFDELPKISTKNMREELGISPEQIVFGFHQRPDDGIYSPVPLTSYKQIENDNTFFVLLGGSTKYVELAKELNIKNFKRIEPTGNKNIIDQFLNTLNVYTHGRKDGETFSMAIAEAMYHKLPIISHAAPAMGHVETIGGAGVVVDSYDEYVFEMKRYMNDSSYYKVRSERAKERFNNFLSLESNMKKWVGLYHNCFNSSFKEKFNKNEESNEWLDDWLVD